MNIYKTIAAIITPQGIGGIAVLRVSGDAASIIVDKIYKGKKSAKDLKGYEASFGKIFDSDGKTVDEVVILKFEAPRSFTGEEVVEISCHGGVYTSRKILKEIIKAGATAASAGEFSKRAFLNGKMDLSQAESVIELIHSTGKRMHETAISVKEGRLTKEIEKISEKLKDIGGDLSAWADYPDDDVPQVDEDKLLENLNKVNENLSSLILRFDSGKIYREGVNTVIAGRPNAGKSTLMNLLSGCERSIVTEIAGTTRDVVVESVMLGDIPLILSDTAGIRHTDDPVEKIGVKLAREKIESAELVFAVFDSSGKFVEEDKELIKLCSERPSIAIINKCDLESKADLKLIEDKFEHTVFISALSGEGLEKLQEEVEKILHISKMVTGMAELCTQRQREAVERAKTAVDEAINALNLGLTLDAVTVMAEEATANLLELKGEKVSEALVANVFSRFCVGK